MLQQHRALASIGFRVNPTISKLHLVQSAALHILMMIFTAHLLNFVLVILPLHHFVLLPSVDTFECLMNIKNVQ